MKKESVPQDNSSTYDNNKKVIYATDIDGDYETVASTGWNVEESVTIQALEEYERLCNDALKDVNAGIASPLLYHMYSKRMDIKLLAESTGFFKWQIKKHLTVDGFKKLSEKKLSKYAEALGIDSEHLKLY